jgi:hypothetical protein
MEWIMQISNGEEYGTTTQLMDIITIQDDAKNELQFVNQELTIEILCVNVIKSMYITNFQCHKNSIQSM